MATKKEEFVIDRTLALDRVTTMDSGVEGLIKIVSSSKTSPEIVRNYSKVVLRDRLDILVSPDTKVEMNITKLQHLMQALYKQQIDFTIMFLWT